MAYSATLAERIRERVARRSGVNEMKMFGGIGFMLNGNMLIGVWNDSLIVRLSPEEADSVLNEPGVKMFDITGRPMKGWILVAPEGVETEDQLQNWIDRAVQFVDTLPLK